MTAAVDAVVNCERMAEAISTASSEGLEAANSGVISANGLGAYIEAMVLGATGAVGVAI